MALVALEGFGHFASADMPEKYWSAWGAVGATAGRRGGPCGIQSPYSVGFTQLAGPATTDTIIVGLARKGPYGGSHLTVLGDSLSSQVTIKIDQSDGTIVAERYHYSSPVELGRSAAATIYPNTWYYVECKVRLHGSTGAVYVRVNNRAVLSLTGQNTLASGSAVISGVSIQVQGGYLAAGCYLADVYIFDSSGSVNNDFIGDCRVDTHFPVTPDGAHHDFTPYTGGDNFAMVDDPLANITDYNSADTIGMIDTFNMEPLKNPDGEVLAIQTNVHYSKSDTGSCLLAPVLRSGGTDFVGDDVAPSAASYRFVKTPYDQNPDGPAAWDETTFNAIEVGYKRTG